MRQEATQPTQRKKVIIVGGVAGGASAATRLRRLDEHAEIILFERGEFVSFANCGLPYYIGDVITERDKLLVQTPEALYRRFGIDVRTFSEVVSVQTADKTVTIRSKDRGTYTENYDALILSPGAKPMQPPIPGLDTAKHVYTLRNIPDMDNIKARVSNGRVRHAAVIGGGFIGVEMAENLRELGLDVTLIEAMPQIMAPLDQEMAYILEQEMRKHGVALKLGKPVTAFRNEDNQVTVQLGEEEAVTADLVILAIGVQPDTGFLRDSGIALGPRGHILVDEHLRTNAQDVYAVGDAVETTDYVTGSPAAIPLAGPANKQGRIAANQIAGMRGVYKGTQGTSIIKVFDLVGAATGLNERRLKQSGIEYRTVTVHPGSHAGYYPGATQMTLKLLFGLDGRVLGAQAVGADGVDKRIDVIATVIRLRGSVSDLTELELAYAPPFSSAKDPVNMAGYLAENVLGGLTEVISTELLDQLDPEQVMLVDVRNPSECSGGMIPGAVNIPLDDIRDRLDEFDPEKEIWVYCQVGLRGYLASRILAQRGFKVKNLTGGWRSYMK